MKDNRKEKFYIRNKDLLPLMIEYKKTKKISAELGEMIFRIASNYSKRGNFSSYTWRRDMVSEAVLTCLKYMHNFDPEKQKSPNPFSYFTTICHNSFINYIRKQKKHSKIKDILYKNKEKIEEDIGLIFEIKGINYQELRDK